MKKTLLNIILGSALTLSFAAVPTTASAHRDENFEQTLKAASEPVRMAYENAHLKGQLGHKLVIVGQTQEGELMLDEALAEARMLEHELLRNQVLHHIANEVASTDDFERALSLREEITDLELRTKLGWKLVNKLGKAGEGDRAQALLDEMVVQILAVEGDLELRAELLAGTGSNYRFTDPAGGVALVYEAYGLAQGISSAYERGLFFNEIGANMMDIKHSERAVRLFERSRNLLDDIQSPLERARFLAMLGGEQAEKGRRDDAARDLELGVAAALKVAEGEDRNDVLSEIARNFGQSYQFERGLEVADMIPDPYYRAEGYIRIAKNMHREGQKPQALQLLERSAELAESVDSFYLRGTLQRKLAAEWISLKDYQRASALLAKAINGLPSDNNLAQLSAVQH